MKIPSLILVAAAPSLLGLACSDGSAGLGPSDPAGSEDPDANWEPPDDSAFGVETRIVRLSHSQYDNAIRDLLGTTATPVSLFPPDALGGFGFDTTTDLQVDGRLGPQYRTAAEELAAAVVADAALMERVVPCNAADAGCEAEFLEIFGERAFRRPLRDAELTRFSELFAAAGELGNGGDAFDEGVQLVLEAMLQSPQFLYRTEVSSGNVIDGRESLDDWEIASRLSFFIYDSMPDDELFEQARQGELHTPEQVTAQVTRMLDDPRATRKLSSFHAQLWQFGRFAGITPDAEAYPNAPDDMVERVARAADAFVSSVIDDGGGLQEFLTAPYAFADAELAPLYGREVEGDLERIDFDANERKGFLMQAGFLASNAYSIKTDPIHRGLFVLRDLLCREIPEPPPGAQMTPPPETDEPVVTTRDEITLLTGQLYCPTCHGQINEPGFAFEGFDAIGQQRQQENGVDVDTTGSIELDGVELSFDGAHDLVELLADSQEARDCYARRLMEFASGRPSEALSDPQRSELAAGSLGVRDLVVEVVRSPEFLGRDVGEGVQ